MKHYNANKQTKNLNGPKTYFTVFLWNIILHLAFFGVKSGHDVFLTSVLRFAPSGSRNLFPFWRHKALSRKDKQETEGELDLDQVLQEEFIARNQTYTRGPNRSCGKWAQLVRVWGERWGRPSPCDWCPAGGAGRRGTPWTPGIWGTGPGSASAADVDSEPLERTDPHLMSEEPQMMIRPRPEESDWSWLQSSHYSSGVNENRQVFPNPPRQQNEQEMMQANAVSAHECLSHLLRGCRVLCVSLCCRWTLTVTGSRFHWTATVCSRWAGFSLMTEIFHNKVMRIGW